MKIKELFNLNSHIQPFTWVNFFIVHVVYFPIGITLLIIRFFFAIIGIIIALTCKVSNKFIKFYLLLVGIHVNIKNFNKNFENVPISIFSNN
jgi:hypothetical protein